MHRNEDPTQPKKKKRRKWCVPLKRLFSEDRVEKLVVKQRVMAMTACDAKGRRLGLSEELKIEDWHPRKEIMKEGVSTNLLINS